jgi:hypothetical protein
MKALLDDLLPRFFPGMLVDVHFKCIPHEGKSDLDRSIPRKLRQWRVPHDRFIVVRDNDNMDCRQLKSSLVGMCNANHRSDTLVRLVCQELESWYLGDLDALSRAFQQPRVGSASMKRRFLDPDSWQKPSKEVERLIKNFQKLSGARVMARHLDPNSNSSRSFQSFVDGVRRTAAAMGYSNQA